MLLFKSLFLRTNSLRPSEVTQREALSGAIAELLWKVFFSSSPLAWKGLNLNKITRWRNSACPSYETELIKGQLKHLLAGFITLEFDLGWSGLSSRHSDINVAKMFLS